MPVYKHIAAQQKKQEKADKLRAQKRRRGEDDQGLTTSTAVGWSDEDSDDDEEVEDDDEEVEDDDEEDSDDEEAESGEEDEEDEDQEMASEDDDEDDDEAEAASDDDEGLVMDANDPLIPRKPPAGFPSAVRALTDPIASSVNLLPADERPTSTKKEGDAEEEADEEEEELPLVCVVCPNKVLKKGKMVQVHLGSKDHLRRLARFRSHLESADCPASHKTADARWVSSELDRQVFERLSRQTELGGKKAGTTKPPAENQAATAGKAQKKEEASDAKGKAAPAPARPLKRKADAVSKADADGTSVREQIRLQKKERNQRRKEAKREKAARMKVKKTGQSEDGEEGKEKEGAIKMALPPSSHAAKPKRRFIEKAKPTAEEIQLRQQWKEQRRLAREAGLAEPPKPLLAYEYGGDLDKVPKAVRDRFEKMQAAYEKGEKAAPTAGAKKGVKKPAATEGGKQQQQGGKGKQGGGGGKAGTGPSPKAAKRKEKKERRKSESGAPEMLPEV
ncbi:hypothetical protein JCM10908_006264 [Rhodotorula pacifica]|uniref:uncharacterized protein n=1 Tax=Rhodotorula pacifica TaxID=1495444 RepID=UPI003177815E